ncbi:MAG: DUF2182 domain-containing protein [Rhodobacteraceae bacterium]|nr:MAG: DUF2182 domain-containing protein [Paracoccaceae bacterium]
MNIRSILWLGFFAVILVSWWWLYTMATDMGLDPVGRPVAPGALAMRTMDPRMDMAMPMAEFGPLFAMWAVMMAAMMLPTMVPTLRTYEDLMVSANGTRGGWLGVVAGFLLVWIGFAAVIAGVQLALLFGGVIDMLGIATSPYVAGLLLMLVGIFQFTRVKDVCHGICHSPMSYFLTRWRPGAAGGLRMGLNLGAYCVGCCWGFMALGFVGGMMSLLWMGLATLFMVLEKLPQLGHYLVRPMGFALVFAGLAVVVWSAATGGTTWP